MTRNMSKNVEKSNLNFSNAINYLFYATKLVGLKPHSLSAYYKHKKLQTSFFGNLLTIFFMIGYLGTYHYIATITYFDGKGFDSGKNLEIDLKKD